MGISQEEKGRSKSLGLVGMGERALIFGGTLEIKGQKGRETAVFLRLPL
jgi:signal transduction histidine kinase